MARETSVRGDLLWHSIPAMARAAGSRFGADEAVVDGETRLSFAQLWALAHRAGRAFIAAGVSPGDRVAIWCPNCVEWIIALLGLQSAGAALVPLNTRYKGGEAAEVLRRSRTKIVCTVTGFLGNDYVGMLAEYDLPDLRSVIILRGRAARGTTGWSEFLAGGEAVPAPELDERIAALDSDDICDIMFTSGTTGIPKGVPATHAMNLRAYADWATLAGLHRYDRYLVTNPFFHSFGYRAGVLVSLIMGATIVPQAVFDVGAAVDLIGKHSVTTLAGPPAIFLGILNHAQSRVGELSSCRLAVVGAASIPADLIERMQRVLGFETVLTAYGLTESTAAATICRLGDSATTIATTSGRALPDVDLRILDDHGDPVPAGQAGEIVIRGYNVMAGYFEDPERTAEVIDNDGRLHTGDVGTLDADGYLKVTGRIKDIFIVGGFNVHPAEVENILAEHPSISHVAVTGLSDERMGEIGAAFIVPLRGEHLEPQAIIDWSRTRMANFKVPRKVIIVDSLPVNASGKVLKHELRALA